MAKRRSDGGGELNLDSLMDAVTNVVGVLMIVLVMMALNTAQMVQKILSDLPPVTPEEHQKMQEQVKALPPPPADPKKIVEDKVKADQELKKAVEQLKTVDTSEMAKEIYIDLEVFRKKLDDAKKERAKEKVEMDKLLTEVERLKALIDRTPLYEPPPPTYVRLPNPRPYPKDPNETKILVAAGGIIILNEKAFIEPIIDGLGKVKSQLEYKDPKIDPFLPMLTKIFGSGSAAQSAWPELAPLAGTFQMDQVALAYKGLAASGMQPNKAILTSIGDIAVTIRSTLPAVAEAMVAASKGDLTKWTSLDPPSKDPTKPTIKATLAGGKITFTYGSAKPEEVRVGPREVLNYFTKDLAGLDAIKNKSRSKVIYDAFKLQAVLERAASNPSLSGSYNVKPTIKPGSTLVQLALTPKAGGGEKLDQMRVETSNYQRTLRQIKVDPKGVVVYQVMSDAFAAYLEARKIADNIGVAATWVFLANLDLNINVAGYEVQRFAEAPPPRKPNERGVNIAAPPIGLD